MGELVSIPLIGGAREDIAAEVLPPGSFRTFENARVDKHGEIVRRSGYLELGDTYYSHVLGVTTLSSVNGRLMSFRGAPCLLHKGGLVVYSAELDGWVQPSALGSSWILNETLARIQLTRTQTGPRFTQQTDTDNVHVHYSEANGYGLIITADPTTEYWSWQLIDLSNNAVVNRGDLSITFGNQGVASVRMASLAGDRYVVAMGRQSLGPTLHAYVWDMDNPHNDPIFDTAVTSVASSTTTEWDMIADPDQDHRLVVAGYMGSSQVQISSWVWGGSSFSSGGTGTTITSSYPVTVAFALQCSTDSGATRTFFVAFYDTNGDVRGMTFRRTMAAGVDTYSYHTANSDVLLGTGYVIDRIALWPAVSSVYVYCSRRSATAGECHNRGLRRVSFSESHSVGAFSAVFEGMALAGKWLGDYVLLRYDTYTAAAEAAAGFEARVIQSTLLVGVHGSTTDQTIVVGFLQSGTVAPAEIDASLPLASGHYNSVNKTYRWGMATTKRIRTITAYTGTAPSATFVGGFAEIKEDIQQTWCEEGGALYFQLGQLWKFDGSGIHSVGFPIIPQGIVGTGYVSGSGAMTSGATYMYRVVWVHTDGNGNVERSAPSVPASVTLGGSDTAVSLVLPENRCAYKDWEIHTEIYRTVANSGGPYYLAKQMEGGGAANDLLADSALGETLYTDFGEVDHIQPHVTRVASHRNRLFVLSAENRVYYSKQIAYGFSAEFNDALVIEVDRAGGDITNLGSMDGALFIGRERDMVRVYGDGPGPNGLPIGAFSSPERVKVAGGVSPSVPMVDTAIGLIFKSPSGFYALQRDMTVRDLNVVQSYKDSTPVDIVEVPNEDELRIAFSDSGELLSYNHKHSVWSVDDPLGELRGAVRVGDDLYVRTGAVVWKDSKGTDYGDPTGSPFIRKVTTGDLRLVGIPGFHRVRWIYLFGKFLSEHTTTVTIYYPDGSTQVKTYTLATADEPYLLRIKPSKQKATSLYLEIKDSGLSGTGEGCSLYAIGLDIMKKGKIPLKGAKTK